MERGSLARAVIAAIIVWVAGVVTMRLIGDVALVPGSALVICYVVAALAGPPTVWAIALITGCRMNQALVPTVVVAMLALMADGVAMGFVPELYVEASKIVYLAPLFLWAFGWGCASAFVLAGAHSNWARWMSVNDAS